MARRSAFLFSRFLGTALLVAVPLLGVHTWTLYRDLHEAEDQAYREVQAKARRAGRAVTGAIEAAERLLTFVASHPDVTGSDPVRCNAFLRGLEAVEPTHAVVTILDTEGEGFCISVTSLAGPPSSAKASMWFKDALAKESFHLGRPAIGRITRRAVAPLSLRVHGTPGAARTAALAVVSFDLVRLESSMVGDWKAEGGVLALLDAERRFLVRSPDTLRWIGKGVTGPRSSRTQNPEAIVETRGVDGQMRIFASSELAKYGLRVTASIPTAVVLEPAHAEIRRSVGVACAALLLAALVALWGASSLSRPVRSLATTVRRFRLGHADARADESLPGEFRELASEMNAMHAAREQSAAAAAEAQRRVLRLARFYEATSRTNKAIVRLKDAAELYDAICAICVDTGQASMAWIGLMAGNTLTPVAWSGPARAYTQGLVSDPNGSSLTVEAELYGDLLEGRIRIVDDYAADQRTLLFLQNAEGFDVRASAIVPFSCGAALHGTINLYASECGFFDADVELLLSGMAEDLSFALDNLQRAAAHARTVAELASREGQLRGIIESATDAIVTLDAAQRIMMFNRAAATMFQVPVAVAIGQRLDRFIPESERAVGGVEPGPHDAADPEREPDAASRQLSGRRSDGTEFPIVVSTFTTDDAAGTLTTLSIRDQSRAREAERARLAAAESDSANRAKTEFLSRMSHELRTPLNAVLGFSQLLQESATDKLDKLERHQLDLIYAAGTQLGALVDDVLDLAGIESGRLSLACADIELTALLDEVFRMSEAAAMAAGVRLVDRYSTLAPVMLHTDPVRLRQVVLNLVSNGIKYNRPHGCVTVCLTPTAAGVCLAVADTGMGMSTEQLAGLFEPFNRLGRENGAIPGSGIGMALARQLVQMMDGSVVVESATGVGTTVRVELPVRGVPNGFAAAAVDAAAPGITSAPEDAGPLAPAPAPVPVPAPPVSASAPTAAPSALSGRILYIEDAPVNVLIVKHALRRWPAVELVVAIDGRSGIEQAKALRPDIVLLDMRLPDMSGLDVLKALRADPATRALTVIALSASAMPLEVRTARAAGAHDYWTKPIDLKSFTEGVNMLLSPAPTAAPASTLSCEPA